MSNGSYFDSKKISFPSLVLTGSSLCFGESAKEKNCDQIGDFEFSEVFKISLFFLFWENLYKFWWILQIFFWSQAKKRKIFWKSNRNLCEIESFKPSFRPQNGGLDGCRPQND